MNTFPGGLLHRPAAEDPSGQLQWLTTAIQHAQNTNTLSANTALPNLYRKMATCHNALQEQKKTGIQV
ncbi:MAG: hypothetical protein R2806_21610 [Saprospiraceae bacterium]